LRENLLFGFDEDDDFFPSDVAAPPVAAPPVAAPPVAAPPVAAPPVAAPPVAAPPVAAPPVAAPDALLISKAIAARVTSLKNNSPWTQEQDTWLANKYLQRPTTKVGKNTQEYWNLCAEEITRLFAPRTAAGLMKRLSLLKLVPLRRTCGRKMKPAIGAQYTPAQLTWIADRYYEWRKYNAAATLQFWTKCANDFNDTFPDGKRRTADAIRKQTSVMRLARLKTSESSSQQKRACKPGTSRVQVWNVDAEQWISANVHPTANLSNAYLESFANDFHKQFPNEPKRTRSAWHSKIKRMLHHLLQA
jgi:hypothetical protein